MREPIIVNWKSQDAELFGKHNLQLRHRLHESPLFSDEALAGLIENYPLSHYNLHYMASPDEPRQFWRQGEIGKAKGEDVIQAIRNGRMWINLRKVMEIDPRYDQLLKDIFSEFESYVPGLKTFKHNFGILISSPKAQVYYHSDVPGQSLWQIRGRKRIWIYPNSAPFLLPEELEALILNITEEEVRFENWFDEHAAIYDLEPGDMLHWPLNGPHRVVNEDVLNVSVTTEHWTPEIRKSYAVNFANGLLRRKIGVTPARNFDGPSVYAKATLTALYKYSGLQKRDAVKPKIDFRIDPASPKGLVDIPAFLKG
jgi:hypothetical protein